MVKAKYMANRGINPFTNSCIVFSILNTFYCKKDVLDVSRSFEGQGQFIVYMF